jgi:uncharacterized membrane protein YhaH (DUF805 family)
MDWYKEVVLNKYAEFAGRAHRAEYWNFFLVNVVIYLALSAVESLVGIGGALSGLYGLAVLIPGIAAAVRRLHDTGRRGWWVLLALVPVLGTLALLVLLALEGEPGANAYGDSPAQLTT